MSKFNILQEVAPHVYNVVSTIEGDITAAEEEAKKFVGRIAVEAVPVAPTAPSAPAATPVAPAATTPATASPAPHSEGLLGRIVQDILHPSKILGS